MSDRNQNESNNEEKKDINNDNKAKDLELMKTEQDLLDKLKEDHPDIPLEFIKSTQITKLPVHLDPQILSYIAKNNPDLEKELISEFMKEGRHRRKMTEEDLKCHHEHERNKIKNDSDWMKRGQYAGLISLFSILGAIILLSMTDSKDVAKILAGGAIVMIVTAFVSAWKKKPKKQSADKKESSEEKLSQDD